MERVSKIRTKQRIRLKGKQFNRLVGLVLSRLPTLLKVMGLGCTSKGVSGGLRNGDKAGLWDALGFKVAAVVEEEEVLWVAREQVVVG